MRKEVDLINIGNSKGVRLPKHLIEACGFENTILLDFQDGQLILSAKKKNRENWEKKFNDKHSKKEELEFIENKFDKEDWTW